jgi:hypothetical protein
MDQPKKYSITAMLLDEAQKVFLETKIDQVKGNRKNPIKLVDCLMSALAMFGLKFPSLLQFDQYVQFQKNVTHNLTNLYKINAVPSDTYMRQRLDEVNPQDVRKIFKTIFSFAQRRGALEEFQFIDGHYLLPFDGTQIFSSKEIFCTSCCKKEHRDGTNTYYHQILAVAIVHPKLKQVIPLAPEPIDKKDGRSKNDCEFNAALRLIDDFRREHPHLKVIATADGLFAKAPIIRHLESSNMRYIIGAKPGDHRSLFDFVTPILKKHVYQAPDGTIHEYYYVNKVPLNDANEELEVNFLEYHETSPKGKKLKFSWVTDISISEANVHQIMQGGRARWKIESVPQSSTIRRFIMSIN